MGLSTTLNIAQSALTTNAALTTLVSRNIAGVNDPNYSSRSADLVTTPYGSQVGPIRAATDDALFTHLLQAKSDSAASSAVSTGLDKINETLGLSTATTTDTSPATMLGALTSALQQYAASPVDTSLGQAAVTAAQKLAANLNTASATVQSVRADADSGIAAAVITINSLLKQFGDANNAVITATSAGADTSDALDRRNEVLSELSEQIGITTATTGNGGLAIYTDGGATLFQGTARSVTFAANSTYVQGLKGNDVMVDGVPVTGSDAVMATKSGKIAGLTQMRDTTAVAYGNQLDQIANGLISAFSESDQTGSGAPTVAGLFTASGSTTLPTSITGLASAITVAASVDPSQSGSIALLRDGGIGASGNSAYTANTTGGASYSAHLTALISTLDTAQSFDPTSGGAASGTLSDYAASSVGWFETTRQDASTTSTNKAAVVTQTTTNLSSETGVNLDEQLSKMLDLEHSYQASAELMTTVKNMLDSLLSAVN